MLRKAIGALLIISLWFGAGSVAKAADNLIPNPSVESANSSDPSSPANWAKGYLWGDLDVNYQYFNSGYLSNRSVSLSVSRYVSGDAKWYFDSVAVTPNQAYRYSDFYQSTTLSHVTLAITHSNQSVTYTDLRDAPTAGSWTNYSDTFVMPSDASRLTIFHLLNSVGTLTTDNFSLTPISSSFDRGLVSLTFDDGWKSQLQNGLPLLNQYGYKATFYIITGSVGTGSYMSLSDLKTLKANGHEVASHTVHHYDLTTLSLRRIDAELSQAKSYLEKKVSRPVNSFAYPYGAYNATTTTEVKKYYRSARTVDEGINSKVNFDRYQILAEGVTPQTTLNTFQGWLDQAKNQHQWLVLVYHQVDQSNSDYSVTPAMLNAQLQRISGSGLPVLTLNQSLNELLPQL